MREAASADPARRAGRIPWAWVIVFTVVAAIGILLHSPLLAVSRIEVVGVARSDAVSRIVATGVGEGALLLWVDTGRLESAVAEDPWVLRVAAERVWPNRIVVEVAERRPVAWVEGISQWMMVSADGVVLELAPVPTPDLVRAYVAVPDRRPGDRPTDPLWDEIIDLAVVLGDPLPAPMRLEMRGTELWATVGAHQVRFGHPIDLGDKGRALVALLGVEIPEGSTIDVISPQRPAIIPPPDPQEEVEG